MKKKEIAYKEGFNAGYGKGFGDGVKGALNGIVEGYLPVDFLSCTLLPEKIINNDPFTTVIWKDGTKTVIKCCDEDIYDPEIGLAFCLIKRALCQNDAEFFHKLLSLSKKGINIKENKKEKVIKKRYVYEERFFKSDKFSEKELLDLIKKMSDIKYCTARFSYPNDNEVDIYIEHKAAIDLGAKSIEKINNKITKDLLDSMFIDGCFSSKYNEEPFTD